jgi:uncharacterized protein
VLNTALASALGGSTSGETRERADRWGRLVETAVGAHLANGLAGSAASLHYWRERNREVDFVVERGDTLVAIEVKSGRRRGALPGLAAFRGRYPHARPLLVGGDGVPLDEFLLAPAADWL